MADIRAGAENSQALTVKDFQRLMDFYTLTLIESFEGIFQKHSVETYNDLTAGKKEIIQNIMFLEEKGAVRSEMEVNTAEIVLQADASIQLKEKQQVDSLLQADKFYGNKFGIYSQRIEMTEYTSKKSRNGDFILKIMSSRRVRVSQVHQPQISICKLLKIKLGEGVILKELMKVKDWKKYRKKGIVDEFFAAWGGDFT